jgi:hypothetical protein
MINEDAEGTTATWACRFWMVNWTVTRRPFQSPVAFAISSPTFFGAYSGEKCTLAFAKRNYPLRHTKPSGPTFGASADEAPTSPPVALK